MPKLYRFADKEDILLGMYHVCGSYIRQMSDGLDFEAGSRHPVPNKDSLLMSSLEQSNVYFEYGPPAEFYYGFASTEQARRWLYDDSIVGEMGEYLTLYVIDVPEEHFMQGIPKQ